MGMVSVDARKDALIAGTYSGLYLLTKKGRIGLWKAI